MPIPDGTTIPYHGRTMMGRFALLAVEDVPLVQSSVFDFGHTGTRYLYEQKWHSDGAD